MESALLGLSSAGLWGGVMLANDLSPFPFCMALLRVCSTVSLKFLKWTLVLTHGQLHNC